MRERSRVFGPPTRPSGPLTGRCCRSLALIQVRLLPGDGHHGRMVKGESRTLLPALRGLLTDEVTLANARATQPVAVLQNDESDRQTLRPS